MNAKSNYMLFGIGAAIGAGFALLYAPKSGTNTREQLRDNIEHAGEYLEEAGSFIKGKAGRFSQDAQSAIERAHQGVISAVDVASATAQTLTRTAKSLV